MSPRPGRARPQGWAVGYRFGSVGSAGPLGRLLGRRLGPFMITWWPALISRSRSHSATTGLGKSGYQSLGALLLVMVRERPCRFASLSFAGERDGVGREACPVQARCEKSHVPPRGSSSRTFFSGARHTGSGSGRPASVIAVRPHPTAT